MNTHFSVMSFLECLPAVLHGYIDPGSGSYLVQVIVAALLGGLFAIKLFWNRIRIGCTNLFARIFRRHG